MRERVSVSGSFKLERASVNVSFKLVRSCCRKYKPRAHSVRW